MLVLYGEACLEWGDGNILRIVAGKYGGRIIRAPAGVFTRPTAQFLREALFNILAARIGGAVFIDLFAGSGAVGIEALSRGADKVIFADNSRDCAGVIRGNLKLLGVTERQALILDVDITRGAAPGVLRGGLDRIGGGTADIVFADPPYMNDAIPELPRIISESNICAPDGIVIIEHSKKTSMPQKAGEYEKYRGRTYGNSCISFYR